MSNIINVKEERNVLSFDGEVFSIVANSTNFFLQFELDSEWKLSPFVTAIFNLDGKNVYVELDENYMCQIPPTTASRIWFCLTCEPDEATKLSSTILCLDVEETGDTDLSGDEFYENTHANLMGVVRKLLTGEGLIAERANIANSSETQVSLTGDEDIAGVKNFTDKITQKSYIVLDSSDIAKPNLIMNSNFLVNQHGKTTYNRNGTDLYSADRWYLCNGNGSFSVTSKTLKALDTENPTILCQWIEYGRELLKGKAITVSAEINGVRKSATVTLGEEFEQDTIYNLFEHDGCLVRAYVPDGVNTVGVQFVAEFGSVLVLDKVKLEESEFETKYVEPTRFEELLKCMRYYQKIIPAGVGYGSKDTTITFFAPLSIPLRSLQNVVVKTAPKVIMNGSLVSLQNIITTRKEENAVGLAVTDFACELNKEYVIVNGTIYIDAEMYVWLMKF